MISAATGRRTASVGMRRTGYAVAVNAALLFGMNVTPGRSILPFLTAIRGRPGPVAS